MINLIKNIRNFFRRKVIRQYELEPGKQYLYVFEGMPSRDELRKFSDELNQGRKSSRDMVTHGIKIVPASSLQITMEQSRIKSRTHLLKIIKAAIGTEKEFNHLTEILVTGEGLIKITKCWNSEDERPKENRKPGRNH